MAKRDDGPAIRRSETNHHELVVEYGDETRGPFLTDEDAQTARVQWIAELAEAAKKQQQLDDYLRPLNEATNKIKDHNDRRRENGKGQRDSDKRKKITKELEGFDFPSPPIQTDINGPHWFSPFVPVAPSREAIQKWRKAAMRAANKYRQARRNRKKQPGATEAAVKSKMAAREEKVKRANELRAQGKTNKEIAAELGLSVRQVQRLK